MPSTSCRVDPYQWNFLLGLLFGMLNVSGWIWYAWQWQVTYPGPQHAEGMIGGFFLTFAVGFLMTAIPRFTGTATAQSWEQLIAILATLGVLTATLARRSDWWAIALLSNGLLLVRFAVVRFRRAALAAPPPFIFLGLGIAGVCYVGGYTVLREYGVALPWAAFTQSLFRYHLPLFFILGVGSQLIPAILGLSGQAIIPLQPVSSRSRRPFLPWRSRYSLYALSLLTAPILATVDAPQISRYVTAIVVTYIVLREWRIARRPRIRGILAECLWWSAWMLVLGTWMPALFPSYAIHGAHCFFIGGISLMIIGVATRVTLAHGGHALRLETHAWALKVVLIAFVAALVTRLSAPWMSQHYTTHLAYAAICWIIGLAAWAIQFAPFVICRNITSAATHAEGRKAPLHPAAKN